MIKNKTEQFIAKSVVIHSSKYTYENTHYVATHGKVDITCPTHGNFSQRPMDHMRGSGCPDCAGKRKLTTLGFVERANIIHGNIYDYSNVEYTNLDTKVSIGCPTHGQFLMKPRHILQQSSHCPKCTIARLAKSKANTLDYFLSEAHRIHGDTYTYNNVVYQTSHTPLSITCKQHGDFNQQPTHHIAGKSGCPQCYAIRRKGKGGYTFKRFESEPELKTIPARLYVVHITNNNEQFIKVGITIKSITKRFARTEFRDMTIVPIYDIPMLLHEAFCVEHKLHSLLQPHKFFSNTRFGGYTECFKNNTTVNDMITQTIDISLIG